MGLFSKIKSMFKSETIEEEKIVEEIINKKPKQEQEQKKEIIKWQ